MLEAAISLLVFLVGVSIGSFVNTAADRLPRRQSLIYPRSYCLSCNRDIPRRHLLPVISYLYLRGRCGSCGAKIPTRIIVIEILTGLLVAYAHHIGPEISVFLALTVSITILLVFAIIDLENRLILNRAILVGTGVFLLMAPFWTVIGSERTFLGENTFFASLSNSLLAAALAFLFFFLIRLSFPRGIGGGDEKMALLLGLMLGFSDALTALFCAIFAGGIVAAVLLLSGRRGRKDAIPYGPFLALGGIVSLLTDLDVLASSTTLVSGLTGF